MLPSVLQREGKGKRGKEKDSENEKEKKIKIKILIFNRMCLITLKLRLFGMKFKCLMVF